MSLLVVAIKWTLLFRGNFGLPGVIRVKGNSILFRNEQFQVSAHISRRIQNINKAILEKSSLYPVNPFSWIEKSTIFFFGPSFGQNFPAGSNSKSRGTNTRLTGSVVTW